MKVIQVALIVVGSVAVFFIVIALFERLVPSRVLSSFQKYVANPLFRGYAGIVPGWAVIETTGRRSGLPRRVPVGGGLRGDTYWLVAANGRRSQFVRNIEADPRVRVRVHGRWRAGTAHPLPDDDPRRRMLRLNPANGIFISIAGRDLLTVRIDLDASKGR